MAFLLWEERLFVLLPQPVARRERCGSNTLYRMIQRGATAAGVDTRTSITASSLCAPLQRIRADDAALGQSSVIIGISNGPVP